MLMPIAAPQRTLTVTPLTGALGAEIRGVDLGNLDAATFAQIRALFLEHLVIYFPDQTITDEQHLAFSERFGPHQFLPQIRIDERLPQLQIVKREATAQELYVTGENWHADSTFMEAPPLGVVMRAVAVPEVGGDTLFANMYQAYETLSPKLQELLGTLKAVHTGSHIFGSKAPRIDRYDVPRDVDMEAADKETVHPVVRTHPETGRKCLFVQRTYIRRFDGMTEAESKPLLDFLIEHATHPRFQCRVRWHDGQVLIWDNRCTLHRALMDYYGHSRHLVRTTVAGDEPR
jgi:alpha-ketoglutarate-dependent taurine dioxygenase